MREESQRWLKQAQAELKAAADNLTSKNYFLVVSLCHGTIEKGLKAIYIDRQEKAPPRTHDLEELARTTNISGRYLDFLRFLNPSYLGTRYPDALKAVPAQVYNQDEAADILHKTKEVFAWIQSQLNDSNQSLAA